MTSKVSFYNNFSNSIQYLNLGAVLSNFWKFKCDILSVFQTLWFSTTQWKKIMLNDVQKCYKMTVIYTSKEARASFEKKVKLKRDFFFAIIKALLLVPLLLSLQHFTMIFCTGYIFLAICSLSMPIHQLSSRSSTFDEENSWEGMIESSIKGRWFIGFSFLCVP